LALFFRAYFNPSRLADAAYIRRFAGEIDKRFDARYEALRKVVARVVARRQRTDETYNAPTFFKSEAGYFELVEALARSRRALRNV
jgi:hypothetical protein